MFTRRLQDVPVGGNASRIARTGVVRALLAALAGLTACNGVTAGSAEPGDVRFCREVRQCPAKSPLVESITMLQQSGARPRFDPSGTRVAFDRKDDRTGFYHVYISDLDGHVVQQITGRPGDPFRRNSGNAVFSPSGRFLVFIAEENSHALDRVASTGDPGVGLFCNLWAYDRQSGAFTRLTDIEYPSSVLQGRVDYMAVVNPHFSKDGRRLLWTERYANDRKKKWGDWRVMQADVDDGHDGLQLRDIRIGYTPAQGNYVTYMGQFDSGQWLVSGNLDGQDVFGMDTYALDPASGQRRNLTRTPTFWEEDADVTRGQHVIYMSNQDSAYRYDTDRDWKKQKITREYYLTDASGAHSERLTYFNDPGAPEYLGKPAIAVASDVSPDGRLLVGTLGVDYGGQAHRMFDLSLMLIRFKNPE